MKPELLSSEDPTSDDALPIRLGWTLEEAVDRAAAAFAPLADAVRGLVEEAPENEVRESVARGWFRPVEEDRLVAWFSRFLTVRDALWETLGELIAAQGGDLRQIRKEMGEDDDAWAAFGLGYGTACAIVHLDRFLVERLAVHSATQRKLNQGDREHRIPRKRFTAIFESFTDPASALFLDEAIRVRKRLRRRLNRDLAHPADPRLAMVAERLEWLESSLDPSKRSFLRLFVRFSLHSLRRRLASARDQSFFSIMEGSGHVVTEIRDHWRPDQVTAAVRERLAEILRPGDVLTTRHHRAMTNLFLPGFWPHAALHVGTEDDRRRLGVTIDADRAQSWSGPHRVLEALKDGVRFRPLAETLAVDAVAIIRPKLSEAALAEGLARAARHEGKGYNFDFDFFRSDHLVCTEVVYRAFDGLEGLDIPLTDRAGRPTLAPEDLLALALDGAGFEVVAVFGVPDAPDRLFEGDEAIEPLRRSLRADG
jgi:hypothetical protein